MSDQEYEALKSLQAASRALSRCAERVRLYDLTLQSARYAISSDLDEIDAHIQDVRERVEDDE